MEDDKGGSVMRKLDYAYVNLLDKIVRSGEDRTDRTGVGTRSLFGEQITFDLSDGSIPLLTTKKVPYRLVLVELLWFLKGRTDVQWLQDRGVTIWDEWATKEACQEFGRNPGDLGPVYGHQWRRFGERGSQYSLAYLEGVDQISRLVASLTHHPDSRRHIVSAWNPEEANKVTLPPCHTLFQCYVHVDGRLDLHLYARSIDAFLGLPFNIASYATLLAMLARRCGLHRGKLVVSFGDVHVYSNHMEQVNLLLSRTPKSSPTLAIPADPDKALWNYDEGKDFILLGYDPHPAIPAPIAV